MTKQQETAGSLWRFLRDGWHRSPVSWENAGEGERLLQEHLQVLVDQGYGVFYDRRIKGIPRDVVDAIVVGPTGVYVLDAKHWFGEISIENGILYQVRKVRRERTSDVENLINAAKEIAKVTQTYVQPLMVLTAEAQAQHGDFVGHLRIRNLNGTADHIRKQLRTLKDDVVIRAGTVVDERFPPRGKELPQLGPRPVEDTIHESMPHPSLGRRVAAMTGVITGATAAAEAASIKHPPPPQADGYMARQGQHQPQPEPRREVGAPAVATSLHDTFVMPQPTGQPLFREQMPDYTPAPTRAATLNELLRGAGHTVREQASGMHLPTWRSRSDSEPSAPVDDEQKPEAHPRRRRSGRTSSLGLGLLSRFPLPSLKGIGLVSLLVILIVVLGLLWLGGSVVGGMRRCPILSDDQAAQVIGGDANTTRRFWGGGCSLKGVPDGQILIFRDGAAQTRAGEVKDRISTSQQDCGLLVVAPRGARLSTKEPAAQQEVPAAVCVPIPGSNSKADAQKARSRGLDLIAAIRRAKAASTAGVDN